MSEAFKRHIPLWVILVSLLVIAAIIIPVWLGNQRVVEETDTANRSVETSDPRLGLEVVADGFEAPVDIVSTGRAGDGRLFIVEQRGTVRILEDDVVSTEPFLDISDRVLNEGEQGLLGMVFEPNLEERPFVYLNYVRTTSEGRETVIARYRVNDDQSLADKQSEQTVLTVSQPYANHNAGDLAFGPDGYLYIPLGDGGSAGDPQNYAQNLNSLLGKILRLDVSGDGRYAIPDDNPFVGESGVRSEIWSYGWRNPWRFSFDSEGTMWVGDVGQGKYEEINREPMGESGRNYGWRCYEGNESYQNDASCPQASQLTFPVAAYQHEGSGCSGSITGGYVYEGEAFPVLVNQYIAADYCSGKIYRLDTSSDALELVLALDTELGISTFGVDSVGELYVADRNDGGIYRVVDQQ